MLFAVADTETTGLPLHRKAKLSQQPRIIEVAGIITDGINILDEFEVIVNPGVAIEQIITEITGLKNDDLEDKPSFSEVINPIGEYFKKADAVIFHNASFDRSMFVYDLEHIGKTLTDIMWPQLTICTVEESMHRYGRRMKLIELYELLVGPYTQKHRALDDVKLLHEVCKTMGVYKAYQAMEVPV